MRNATGFFACDIRNEKNCTPVIRILFVFLSSVRGVDIWIGYCFVTRVLPDAVDIRCGYTRRFAQRVPMGKAWVGFTLGFQSTFGLRLHADKLPKVKVNTELWSDQPWSVWFDFGHHASYTTSTSIKFSYSALQVDVNSSYAFSSPCNSVSSCRSLGYFPVHKICSNDSWSTRTWLLVERELQTVS